MNKKKLIKRIIETHVDCFGEFESADSICRKKCALSIKCSLEKARSQQLMFADEIFDLDDTELQIQ